MEAREILATLEKRGAAVRGLDDGRVEVRPRSALDEDLRAAIRRCKEQLFAVLRGLQPTDAELLAGPVLETRDRLGAVRLHSRRFDCEIWIALEPETARDLRREEASRNQPRPVLEADDLMRLRGKPEAHVRAVLQTLAAFPEARVIQ